MGGRFPLYTDADVHGPLVDALIRAGWDVLRALDAFPEGTGDDVHFERALQLDRVMVFRIEARDTAFDAGADDGSASSQENRALASALGLYLDGGGGERTASGDQLHAQSSLRLLDPGMNGHGLDGAGAVDGAGGLSAVTSSSAPTAAAAATWSASIASTPQVDASRSADSEIA